VTSSVLPVLGWLAAPPLGYPPFPEQNPNLNQFRVSQFTIQTFSALPLINNFSTNKTDY